MGRRQNDIGTGGQKAPRSGALWRGANALFGVLLLAALLVGLTHLGEERWFAALLTQAAPGWLLVAAGCRGVVPGAASFGRCPTPAFFGPARPGQAVRRPGRPYCRSRGKSPRGAWSNAARCAAGNGHGRTAHGPALILCRPCARRRPGNDRPLDLPGLASGSPHPCHGHPTCHPVGDVVVATLGNCLKRSGGRQASDYQATHDRIDSGFTHS
jgi:hypothetical protein